jgi:hypothetical protein
VSGVTDARQALGGGSTNLDVFVCFEAIDESGQSGGSARPDVGVEPSPKSERSLERDLTDGERWRKLNP